jgi:hypothetical protein
LQCAWAAFDPDSELASSLGLVFFHLEYLAAFVSAGTLVYMMKKVVLTWLLKARNHGRAVRKLVVGSALACALIRMSAFRQGHLLFVPF